MGTLAQALVKYGRPFWAAIGEDNAADVAGATNVAANYLFGPEQVNAEEAFYQGKKDFERGLRNVRFENPYGAFASETLGNMLLGAGAGKVLKMSRLLEMLDRPFQPSAPTRSYPRRTRQQWQADLEYGKERFNALRARGPLKREGHPDARINTKVSWSKIRHGNIPEKYNMLDEVPDIYATGKYYPSQGLYKDRNDDFQQFHWFQKGNRGVQVAEDETGRVLYNVNPDIKRYLLEHPDVAERLGVRIQK